MRLLAGPQVGVGLVAQCRILRASTVSPACVALFLRSSLSLYRLLSHSYTDSIYAERSRSNPTKRMNCRGHMKQYEIRDPVYGFVIFNDREKGIIDHPVFQRLRRINQLALTEMVYPGAVHTRFEHSLGVMHLATMMYNSIGDEKDISRSIRGSS